MSDPVPVLTDEERDAIENAWCISPQDGPEGPDDPMYRAVESILAAHVAAAHREGWDDGLEWARMRCVNNQNWQLVAELIQGELDTHGEWLTARANQMEEVDG